MSSVTNLFKIKMCNINSIAQSVIWEADNQQMKHKPYTESVTSIPNFNMILPTTRRLPMLTYAVSFGLNVVQSISTAIASRSVILCFGRTSDKLIPDLISMR
jgi:hypothetical protein